MSFWKIIVTFYLYNLGITSSSIQKNNLGLFLYVFYFYSKDLNFCSNWIWGGNLIDLSGILPILEEALIWKIGFVIVCLPFSLSLSLPPSFFPSYFPSFLSSSFLLLSLIYFYPLHLVHNSFLVHNSKILTTNIMKYYVHILKLGSL